MTFDFNMDLSTVKTLDMNMGVAVISAGQGGTVNYNELKNKPQINGVELKGDKTAEELNLALADNIIPISGGQMQGALVAQSNTDYTMAQLRNVIISPNEPTDEDGSNGDIWIIYKE